MKKQTCLIVLFLLPAARAEKGYAELFFERSGNSGQAVNNERVCLVTASGRVCDKDERFWPVGAVQAPARAVVTAVTFGGVSYSYNIDGFSVNVSHNKRGINIATQVNSFSRLYAPTSIHFNGQRVESDSGRWKTDVIPSLINHVSGWILAFSYRIDWDTNAPITEPTTVPDFDLDGSADVLWTNSAGGVMTWRMKGTQLAGKTTVQTAAVPGWVIAGQGDFNADGFTDILWTTSNGGAAIWMMEGDRIVGNHVLQASCPLRWFIAGVGDFNGDRYYDILWKTPNGGTAVWLMKGGSIIANKVIEETGECRLARMADLTVMAEPTSSGLVTVSIISSG